MTRRIGALLIILFLAACTPEAPSPFQPGSLPGSTQAPPGSITATPFQPQPNTPAPEISPSPTAEVVQGGSLRLWADPALQASLPPNLQPAAAPAEADLLLMPGNEQPVAEKIYALVAPFPTVQDEISAADLQAALRGNGIDIYLDPITYGVLQDHLGANLPDRQIIPSDQLLSTAWEQNAWAVVPFEALNPRWKVLAVAGQTPLHKDFDPGIYPLTVPFSLSGDPELVQAVLTLYGPQSPQPLAPPTNRDPERLTSVVMTGVTALVRATAWTMERQGMRYPARDIGDLLVEADILHISNEVPFAKDCPFPNPSQSGVVFCSDERYLELLEAVGTDVVELTGDHFHDWGTGAMLYTLSLYEQLGWPVYGGGANFEAGKQAAFLEHNGSRFAFIGCNGKGGSFAQAGADTPGSVRCDWGWLENEITRLTEAGYLVIATFQHFEYYQYAAPPNMQADFERLAEAGAVIVSGSQAHHPHGFAFTGDSLLHYGLGNLFFDQWGLAPGTDLAFIDRHVFYNGRYISTELLTIKFEDYARARLMTPAERRSLLESAFGASDW